MTLPQSNNELSSMAERYFQEGENLLLNNDSHGIALFEKASQLSPKSSDLYFQQGIALFEFGSDESRAYALSIACQKFKQAIKLKGDSPEIYQVWADALMLLCTTFKEINYANDAKEKYLQALELLEEDRLDMRYELYWQYGKALFLIGCESEEPVDFQLALEALQTAENICSDLPAEFYLDLGEIYRNLHEILYDIEYLAQAIDSFRKAANCDPTLFHCWEYLAKSLNRLYHLSYDEEHFFQADHCYSLASKIQPNDEDLTLSWALLLCKSGREQGDSKRLRQCIEKCQKATENENDQRQFTALWAEALASLGQFNDRLDLIYDAEKKVSFALEKNRDSAQIWLSYGYCLFAQASYFNEISIYKHAIEKFECALALKDADHEVLFALAHTYQAIYDCNKDSEAFYLACQFYQKAYESSHSTLHQIELAILFVKQGTFHRDQELLENALHSFELCFDQFKNALYYHPEWLYYYAEALDILGDFHCDESFYQRAIETYSHIAMLDPDFPEIHHRLALSFSQLALLTEDNESFQKALYHFRIAFKHDGENERIMLDWAITLITISRFEQEEESILLKKEAEHKLMQAAQLGSDHAFYQLACLYSLSDNHDKSLAFLNKAYYCNALPPLSDLLEDDWLDNIRNLAPFQDLIDKLEKNSYQPEEEI